jgi:hypothetical protein
MKRIVIASVVLSALSGIAVAGPSKVLVLQSEGRADAKTRQKIDASLVKLARTGGDQISPGEITYSDAAAMVGCKPDEASCKDEVIGTLAVDEIVITTVNPKPGGLEIAVRRIGKGGATREASLVVAPDAVDKLDAFGPVFGLKTQGPTPPGPVVGPTAPTNPSEPPKGPMIGPKPPEPTHDTPPDLTPKQPDTTEPPKQPADKTTATADTTVKPLDQPAGNDDRQPRDRRKLYIGGMGAGGGMLLIGLILWGSASGVENDIDNFRVTDQRSLQELRDLEDKGDSYATWGNVFTLGGLVVGGVSTYLYLKDRKARKTAASSAHLAPAIFDHGGGLTLTFGGAR